MTAAATRAVDRAAGARIDRRLAPIAAAAWLGALLAVHAEAWAIGIAAGAFAVAVLGLVLAIRAPRGREVLALGAVALAAVGAVAVTVSVQRPARAAAAELAGRGEVTATVAITTKVAAHGDRLWFAGVSDALESPRAEMTASVPVRVAIDAAAAGSHRLDLGAVVELRADAAPPEPGAAEALVLFARTVTVREEPAGVLGIAAGLRDAFAARAGALPGSGGELLPGIAVGDTRAVSAELDAAMKASSLSHLTAVSGANCALIVGLVYGVVAWCGAGRAGRIVAAGAALAGFVVLVTPEPSVVRAATMAAIAMVAVLCGHAGGGIAVLSCAVTALLIADPWLSATYGFVLSASATAALLLLAGPLADGLARAMPRPLALALAVPLSAQVVCGPIIVMFAPSVALYGVVANVVAAPAAPLATLLGTAACLLAFAPPLADLLAGIAWLPASWVAATAETFAALPQATMPWGEGVLGAAALAGLGACAVLLIVPPRPGTRARALRRAAAAVLATAVGALGAGVAVTGPIVGPLTTPRDWVVAACDVGQGDAVLVRSGDAVALIDTGPEPAPLRACLDRLGIGRIDLLVLTHFDIDHAGGVAAVRDRVGTVLHGPPDDGVGAVWHALGAGAERVQAAAGMHGVLGDVRWRVLWPMPRSSGFPPGNDVSVVVEMSGPALPRSIFLGDLSAAAQEAMMARSAPVGAYDLVKVAHHGSADQSPALYERLSPAVALVAVGADNDYGHPRASILEQLQRIGAVIARTDTDGLVLVGADGNAMTLWRERGG